jgi:DNA-binding transcriptional LysR family regulator
VLDVTRLRVLVAVARHGSVTAAARALRYAQPSVSHHLARLEAETGSRLTQRVGRGIRLTDAGRLLAERAEEILGRLDAAETELAAHTGLRAGRVRLAAFPSALGTFVPTAAAAFHAAHPDVELRLTEAEPPDAARMLRSGDVDVAILFTHPEPTHQPTHAAADEAADQTADEAAHEAAQPAATTRRDSDADLRRTHLLDEPLYLVAPAELVGDELADHASGRWIAGCERCRAHLVRTCRSAGFEPDIAFTTDDYVAVQALVAAGLGVTTLPALALAAQRHHGVRAVTLPGQHRAVTAAVTGEPPDPPATRTLVRHLVDAAAGALAEGVPPEDVPAEDVPPEGVKVGEGVRLAGVPGRGGVGRRPRRGSGRR